MKTIRNVSKKVKNSALMIAILSLLAIQPAKSQLIAKKPWKGRYPEMGGKYPQFFIATKESTPHVFVKVWPTHYYWDVTSTPATDAGEIDGGIKTGLKRVVSKTFERLQIKGRHEETGGIKINTNAQTEITKELFAARFDQLDDHYGLARGFVSLFDKIDQLEAGQGTTAIQQIYEAEAENLLMRFVMANVLETGHGNKMAVLSEIQREQNKLLGEIDYTVQKARFFMQLNPPKEGGSYIFLSR